MHKVTQRALRLAPGHSARSQPGPVSDEIEAIYRKHRDAIPAMLPVAARRGCIGPRFIVSSRRVRTASLRQPPDRDRQPRCRCVQPRNPPQSQSERSRYGIDSTKAAGALLKAVLRAPARPDKRPMEGRPRWRGNIGSSYPGCQPSGRSRCGNEFEVARKHHR